MLTLALFFLILFLLSIWYYLAEILGDLIFICLGILGVCPPYKPGTYKCGPPIYARHLCVAHI